jgi:hypothetical protein
MKGLRQLRFQQFSPQARQHGYFPWHRWWTVR